MLPLFHDLRMSWTLGTVIDVKTHPAICHATVEHKKYPSPYCHVWTAMPRARMQFPKSQPSTAAAPSRRNKGARGRRENLQCALNIKSCWVVRGKNPLQNRLKYHMKAGNETVCRVMPTRKIPSASTKMTASKVSSTTQPRAEATSLEYNH